MISIVLCLLHHATHFSHNQLSKLFQSFGRVKCNVCVLLDHIVRDDLEARLGEFLDEAVLQRIRDLLEQGYTWDEAVAEIRRTTVFTTHTPVPAGHDAFPFHLVEKYLAAADKVLAAALTVPEPVKSSKQTFRPQNILVIPREAKSKDPGVKIVVVANAEGIDFLLDGAQDNPFK